MKFVVDECTGPSVANWLQQEGHDVLSIFDFARGSDDDHVLSLAYNDGRVLTTSDKDFGALVFREKRQHHGIILLRLTNPNAVNYIAALERLFRQSSPLLDRYIVISDAKIRTIDPLLDGDSSDARKVCNALIGRATHAPARRL